MKKTPGVFLIPGVVMICAALARAQSVSPADAREQARFDAVARAAVKAGFTAARVVGHGQGSTDALFALTAEQAGHGALVALIEPTGSTSVTPLQLEQERTPADLGLHGLEFIPFLGQPDLVDIEVTHRPFMLETSRTFSTHYVVRRQGSSLTLACTFDGSSTSSSSKGIGSMTSARHVSVEAVPGRPTLTFGVKVVDETTEQRTSDRTSATTSHAETLTLYELPATGPCRKISRSPST